MPEDIVEQNAEQSVEPVVAPPPPPTQQVATGEKTMVIPHSAIKRIREEERLAGRQTALDEYARANGFGSAADMATAIAQAKAAPKAPAARQPAQASPEPVEDSEEVTPESVAKSRGALREQGRHERQLEKTLNERNRYAQQAADWQRKAKEAREEADAVRAEMHLRTVAASKGVQDIDYAITLLTREVENLTPEAAASFEEAVFFEGLRKTKPLLFGEAVQPATTGVGTGSAPTAPKPAQAAAQNGANSKVNARDMSPAEYRTHLAKMGISPV